MFKLSTIARTTAALALCACASSGASKTPSAATLALYDAAAYRPTSSAAEQRRMGCMTLTCSDQCDLASGAADRETGAGRRDVPFSFDVRVMQIA